MIKYIGRFKLLIYAHINDVAFLTFPFYGLKHLYIYFRRTKPFRPLLVFHPQDFPVYDVRAVSLIQTQRRHRFQAWRHAESRLHNLLRINRCHLRQ